MLHAFFFQKIKGRWQGHIPFNKKKKKINPGMEPVLLNFFLVILIFF
jgi:hypothetical protein